jgi:hypothetical protein
MGWGRRRPRMVLRAAAAAAQLQAGRVRRSAARLADAPTHPPAPQDWDQTTIDWFNAKKSADLPLPTYKLNFLWLDKNIAVAVDQVRGGGGGGGRRGRRGGARAARSRLPWPRTRAPCAPPHPTSTYPPPRHATPPPPPKKQRCTRAARRAR